MSVNDNHSLFGEWVEAKFIKEYMELVEHQSRWWLKNRNIEHTYTPTAKCKFAFELDALYFLLVLGGWVGLLFAMASTLWHHNISDVTISAHGNINMDCLHNRR